MQEIGTASPRLVNLLFLGTWATLPSLLLGSSLEKKEKIGSASE